MHIAPPLPVEVLDQIVDLSSRADQACFLRINPTFNAIARRLLYRSISIELSHKCITLLRTLSGSRSKLYSHLVHTLDIILKNSRSHPIGNFARLLNRALQSLANLTTLSAPGHPLQICKGCTFSLKNLSAECRVDPELGAFLALHPSIDELCIRGGPGMQDGYMCLPSSILPNLSAVRLLIPDPALLRSLVHGRPVRHTSVIILQSFLPYVEALALSAVPVERVSMMFFECPNPSELLIAAAKLLPEIEALHVVILTGSCPLEPLKLAAPLLSSFLKLRFITFMAGDDKTTLAVEREVAELWQKACPSLKTIILPNGVVWFCKPGGDIFPVMSEGKVPDLE
ncbi:hypothetical protein HWV62_14154 [Athelia sp. TMB]|nr:hypothetical protein HWV62_14154 [Athelia sp. TMB]